MTTVHESMSPAVDEMAWRLLGLTLGELQLLPDRSIIGATALLARQAGVDGALALLDAVSGGAESATLAGERVRLLLEAGRLDAAVTAARDNLARKESLTVRGLLVRALLNTGALDDAEVAARAMLDSAPENVTPLYAAGLVALARHDSATARAHFERLLQLHEDSPTGLRGLARVALAEGDAATALDLAGQALDRYSAVEAPPDLVRELALYAERIDDHERAALARRRADELLAARDAALPAKLAEALARVRDGGERPRRSRDAGHSRAAESHDADELSEREQITALPPAPAPDPEAHDGLVMALREVFGYTEFRAGQEEAISAVIREYDTLAVMPTGAGKSLCYQLPATLLAGVTLVISPLIALMKDQVESLPPALLAQTTFVNSSLESAELALRLNEIAAGRYRLVYAAPERLRQRPFIHALARAGVVLAVIDEAHCLSMWGHDFRPDYLFIRHVLPDLGSPRVLAMTATATPEMMAEIAAQLGRDLRAVNTGVLRDNLYLIARRAENEDHKLRLLLPFMQRQRGCGIVYVNSRDHAEMLEKQLRQAGINARAYHAGMGAAERSALQDRFMSGEVRVMVATVAFGMGVDKADVRFVIHYNPPRSLEAYSQESGRAGRDGKPAVCLLLHTPGDRTSLKKWSKEEAVDLEGLRAVYRVLRGLLRGGAGLVDATTLRERLEAEQQGEVDLRVAVSILENAGLLRRGPDVPRGATIIPRAPRVEPHDAEPWMSFMRLARLDQLDGPLTRPAPVDLVFLATELGMSVAALEDHLLNWQEEQRLTYRGVGRDMLIELLPPPPDTAERMASILDGMGRRNRRRLRSLFAYLDTERCRHGFIARHFGHGAEDRCRRCDICRPVTLEELQTVKAPQIDDPAEGVRRLVARFPLFYGKPGVVEVLKGVTARRQHAGRAGDLFGALAHLPKAAIERAVDRLLAEGELVSELRDNYRVLRPRDMERGGEHGWDG